MEAPGDGLLTTITRQETRLWHVATIMDKILGTDLHLWRFFSRYTCSAPPPTPPSPYNVGHVYTLFLQSFNIVLGGRWGEQRILKRITVFF